MCFNSYIHNLSSSYFKSLNENLLTCQVFLITQHEIIKNLKLKLQRIIIQNFKQPNLIFPKIIITSLFTQFLSHIRQTPMKQQQIDELLMSSDDENSKNRKKQLKKQKIEQQNYDDDFFQSQNIQETKKNKGSKKSIQKVKPGSLKKIEGKQKQKTKTIPKQPSQVDEENYLNSQDFESQVSEGDQKFKPMTKPKAEVAQPKHQPQLSKRKQTQEQQQENYQVQDDFEQQVAGSKRSRLSNASKAESQDLVQSQYTQSRAQAQQQEIQEIADNVDEDIQTVKSSKMRSQLLNDDQMSQAQSQYIQSTRINQQNFKKKNQTKQQVSTQNPVKKTGPIINSVRNVDMKKKKPQPTEPLSAKKLAIPSKKSIPQISKKSITQNRRSQGQTSKPSQKNTIQLNPPKNKSQKSKQPQPQLRPSKIQSTSHLLGKGNGIKKNASEVEAQIQERQANIAQIQAEKKALQQKRTAKQRQEQQQGKQQYEQMKKKQQQRKQKNRKILQQKKKKQQSLNATLPKDANKRATLQKQQLNLTDSKIKQLAQQQDNKKQAKAKMQIAQQMKRKRKHQQQQVKSKLQKQNQQKLKKLQHEKQGYMDKTYQQKKQYKDKREQAIKDKKEQYKNNQSEKLNEKKQAQTPEIRKIKQEIVQLKEKTTEKQQTISGLDDIIKELKKQKKQKQLTNYNQGEDYDKAVGHQANNNSVINVLGLGSDQWIDSQLTPVQHFVRLFDQCHNTAQIFNLIDEDKDQLVSLEQLKSRVTQILLSKQLQLDQSQNLSQPQQHRLQLRNTINHHQGIQTLIQQVFTLLDKNSDGNVTQQQFSFIIQAQIKKAKQYRKLTNNIAFTNPIDIQASILDMKEKIKYMNKRAVEELSDNRLQQLQEKYQKYLGRYEEYQKRYIYGKSNTKDKQKIKDLKEKTALEQDLLNDRHYFLTQQVSKLRAQRQNEQKMLQKIRAKQQQNIKQKNLQLTQKVQQNIKLSQQIYKLSQTIQEYQLRFLSKAKIQQNRHRYMAKKSQQKQLYEEAIHKAKEYQMKILNPTKEIKFGTYANQVKYLAAVIMIQRNFRMKKAIREKSILEANRQ